MSLQITQGRLPAECTNPIAPAKMQMCIPESHMVDVLILTILGTILFRKPIFFLLNFQLPIFNMCNIHAGSPSCPLLSEKTKWLISLDQVEAYYFLIFFLNPNSQHHTMSWVCLSHMCFNVRPSHFLDHGEQAFSMCDTSSRMSFLMLDLLVLYLNILKEILHTFNFKYVDLHTCI